MAKRVTIGIDEVGRGALAGPVVLAAVRVRGRVRWFHPALGRIRDSKKLTPRRREAWCAYLRSHPAIRFQISRVSPAVIDRINIARAANLGALRAYRRVIANIRMPRKYTNMRVRPVRILKRNSYIRDYSFALLDGGLALPEHIPHRVLVKGDERIPLIAAASIIAKVWRDRLMVRMAAAFPRYGFELHKGYGTRFHQKMLKRHGPSAVHRRSFLTWLGHD